MPWWTGSPTRGNGKCGSRPSARTCPVDVLVALARGHIVFCRRDIARVMMALRVEFDGREHPVGTKVADIGKDLAYEVRHRDLRGHAGMPRYLPGPPAKTLGAAITAAVEGLAIHLAGAPHDEVMAERMVRGLLGISPKRR